MNYLPSNPKPNFNNLLKVLNNERPNKATLFEFFLNDKLYSHLAKENIEAKSSNLDRLRIIIKAFYNAGYDYATIPTWYTDTLDFPKNDFHHEESRSLNEGCMITDRESFDKYNWPDPEIGDYEIYNKLISDLPEGMKLIACGPGGVLETVIDLVGFENICIMSLMDAELTEEIFSNVGTRLLEYYKIIVKYDSIGALIVNDDWGFKTQTMLDTESMRKYVFPWHKKIVEVIHEAEKPAILHSCGNLDAVFNDVIDDMKYDGKHSFEDGIIPVEKAIPKWGDRISILGGIDMDFLARETPEMVYYRSRKLLEQSREKGGYALGSGNSIPDFIPYENYFSMLKAANEE